MLSSTINALNYTTSMPDENISALYGFVAVIISVIGFGVNFLPVKKYDTGDGMFFQWIVSNAILIGGFIVAGYLKFPKFEPLVMLGGFLWATGNICVVPIIKAIGLGIGMLLWSSSSIIVGWASARFGWFGIFPEVPKNIPMNYVGFCLTVLSPIIYLFLKPETVVVEFEDVIESRPISTYDFDNENLAIINEKTKRSKLFHEIISHVSIIKPVIMSISSGVLFGLMYTPATYVINNYPNSSKRYLDHILPQCSGIYLGSSFYFIIYCFAKRNKPILHFQSILPGLLSGFIWFIASVAFFIANEALSPAISQPIISALPGLVSVIITTVIFHEIRGRRNFLLIGLAVVVLCSGVLLIGLSKFV